MLIELVKPTIQHIILVSQLGYPAAKMSLLGTSDATDYDTRTGESTGRTNDRLLVGLLNVPPVDEAKFGVRLHLHGRGKYGTFNMDKCIGSFQKL